MKHLVTGQSVIDDYQYSDIGDELDSVVYAKILMLSMIKTVDAHTAKHQRRVANLARTIASEMKLSEKEISNIFTAGILHDIGKASIPLEILNKPSKLSPYEFSLVQTHPATGYKILNEAGFLEPVTEAVLQHHERTDGSGYPYGLADKDIILEAKILAIADVVEAISSQRPYRPAMGLDYALEQVVINKSILYDSEVVETCLTLFQNNELKF
jgi:putative nucleotidyltransferase with HDIG domain